MARIITELFPSPITSGIFAAFAVWFIWRVTIGPCQTSYVLPSLGCSEGLFGGILSHGVISVMSISWATVFSTIKHWQGIKLDESRQENAAKLEGLRQENAAKLEGLRQEKDTKLEDLRREKDTKYEGLLKEKDAEIERLRREKDVELAAERQRAVEREQRAEGDQQWLKERQQWLERMLESVVLRDSAPPRDDSGDTGSTSA